MAVDLRGVTSGTRVATSTTTGTVTFHASLAVGDLMVLFVGDANGTTTWPSGWTNADNSDTGGIVGRTYWKIATSGDVSAGSTTYTNTNTVNGGGWILATFKAGSFDTTTPVALNVQVADGGPTTRTPTVASLSMPLRGYGLYFLHRRTDTVGSPNFGTAQSVTAIPGSGTHGSHALYREGAFAATSRALSWSSGSEYGHYAVTLRVNPAATPDHFLSVSSGNRTSGTGTVTFPAGLAAGDEMVLFIGDGDAWTGPTGWTVQSGGIAGSAFDGAWYRKTATSGDVSAGSVTYTGTGVNYGGWVLATFKPGTTFAFQSATRDGLNGSSLPVTVSSASVATGDEALYWIHRRNDTATLTASSGVDTSNITKALGTNAGEQSLFTEDITSSGTRSIQWTTSNNSDYGYYAVTLVATPSAAAAVSVAAPVLAVTVDALDPTVSAGTGATVAAPALAVSTALLAPTVSMGSSVNVAAPVLALSLALLSPTVDTISGAATVDAPVLDISTTLLAPTVSAGTAVMVDAPTLAVSLAVPAPTVTLTNGDPLTVAAPALSLTLSMPAPTVTGVTAQATVFDGVTLEDLLYVSLTPTTELDVAVPILRESHPSPVLTEADPTHQEWVDYTPITEPVGFPHIWVDDVDVTYFRGSPTIVRNWTREMPWGDKTAAWEMPQLNPWDSPGEGDLTWLRKGARVVIGIVDLDGNIDEKWSGRYHARTKGLDERHDWLFEAKGAMWAAMNQILEPVPYQPPIDVGRMVPRLLNKLIGRSFNPIPETVTGIMTRYRGARDEYVWQAVQNILAKAWTDDGRQWSLVQVARDEYRMQLKKPMDEVTATVAYGNPGVDFEVSVDEDSAVDHVFCRWVNPGGGESANVFYPGLELLNGLPYPNADAGDFINAGESDADTSGTGVTDWQTQAVTQGFTTLTVTGTMSSAWVAVVRDVQESLDLTVDGSIGPQTWTATFTAIAEDVDLTPRRLPMAKKSYTWPWVDAANGAIIGTNPDFDGNEPVQVPLDMGTNITRPEVAKAARTYLAVHGTAAVTGSVRFRGCPDNMARTDLTVGDNLEIRGHEGSDVVVQLSRMSVDVTADDTTAVYAVTFDADERARDALTIDQILERNRDALADPARRPGNPNRTSRQVRDEGFSWDADSPCGKLTKTAVNGDTGLWTRRVIPFSEIGQLAGIRLHSTVPFAMMLMASLRMTENDALDIVGNPFDSSDPYRPVWDELEEYGILGAWGAQGDACGYSRGTEGDGYGFTGLFVESTTLEYVTEGPTAPYVSVLLFARGDSGFVWGDAYGDGFLQARQT